MPKYSIITPHFNSFELMGQFFDSMEKQTYKDFELIIIDDCSTDGSYHKLEDRVHNSKVNIKLLQTSQNSGPGKARNIGIDKASGEWITFVDNDDWVDDVFLETINKVIEDNKVNCVIFDYYQWLDGKTTIAHSMYDNKGGVKTVSECIIAVRNHTFAKFYKLSECKQVRFPDVRRCEDIAYVTQAIVACGKVFYYNCPLYYYRQRPTSLSNNSKMDHTDMMKAFAVLEQKFLKDYPLEITNKSVADFLYGGILMMCKAGKKRSEILAYINDYEIKYPEWRKCEIINYLGIFKKTFLLMVRWRCISGLRLLSNVHTLMIK